MELKDRKVLYARAVEKYGLNAQLMMLMEECAELIQAASKIIRNKGNLDNFVEEIGDVEILIEQMKILFKADYEISKNKKLLRFKAYLDGE